MAKSLKQMFPAGQLPASFLRPRTPDPTVCPDCGGDLHMAEADLVIQDRHEREVSRRTTEVLFCSGCEYAKEVRWQRA